MTLLVDALVLRRWSVGEADRRVCLLTREQGKLYALARGARKAKARTGPATEPLTLLHGQIVFGRRNNILAQVEIVGSFPAIRSDYTRLSGALSFFESLDACLQEGDPHPETFDLTLSLLDHITRGTEPVAALTWADLQLLGQVGFGMSWVAEEASESVLVSPSHGGVINSADKTVFDAISVPVEVIRYLGAVQSSSEPVASPLAVAAAGVLRHVWQAVADRSLPARAAWVSLLNNGS